MKIRKGFVTNSSSSSFIIGIKENIPKELETYFKEMTKDNFLQRILNMSYYNENESITNELSIEDEKSLLNVDDNIYLLLNLIQQDSDAFETYLLCLKYFKEHNKPLYYYCIDWDDEYNDPELRQFIKRQEIVKDLN